MATNNWRKFGLGLGVVGAVVLAGSVAMTAARPAGAAPVSSGTVTVTVAQRGAQTPPTPSPAGNLLAQGRQRYDRACGRCHPGGEQDVGPRLTGINWAEARMTTQIRRGSTRMRPIPASRLPDGDLPALMTYLRSIHAVQ
jgi:mono/diheme cytochrome c family protein